MGPESHTASRRGVSESPRYVLRHWCNYCDGFRWWDQGREPLLLGVVPSDSGNCPVTSRALAAEAGVSRDGALGGVLRLAICLHRGAVVAFADGVAKPQEPVCQSLVSVNQCRPT